GDAIDARRFPGAIVVGIEEDSPILDAQISGISHAIAVAVLELQSGNRSVLEISEGEAGNHLLGLPIRNSDLAGEGIVDCTAVRRNVSAAGGLRPVRLLDLTDVV